LEKSGTYNRGVLKLLNVNPITPITLVGFPCAGWGLSQSRYPNPRIVKEYNRDPGVH